MLRKFKLSFAAFDFPKSLVAFVSILCFSLAGCLIGFNDAAWANIQVKISNLSYGSCPPEVANNMVLGGGVMPANCFMIHGKTENSSGKTVYNADVFGRIYDANGNDAMSERNRLGAIAEILPGVNDFELMISVAADQSEPLQFKQFKASGFTSKIRR